jgi:alcohol dehydrogenase
MRPFFYILLAMMLDFVHRVVESVGDGVQDLVPGDHVIPIFTGECRECVYCGSDKTNLCGTYRVDPLKSTMVSDNGTRFSVVDASSGDRRPVYHFLNTSTFTEYTVIDAACAVKINPKAPLEKMYLLSCGISTGNTSSVIDLFGLSD